ncbi:hypothetical protein DBV39_09760 [Orrella marina]|uniref:Integrase catalytic domain-containing protein n=1 Tax=Orrella marina TaxID=2163011 RepID=A0A2R4XJC4_9BURK|nr:hypothetical protein DBV39_09760 [Orrella marina]
MIKTAKYRPEFPARGFDTLETAQQWSAAFVRWYNHEHRHSGIQHVTPDQRHRGEDIKILDARHALYQQQKRKNPARWSGQTRNWSPVGAVTLNPEQEAAVKAEIQIKDKKGFVA